MLFAWQNNCLSKFLWCAAHVTTSGKATRKIKIACSDSRVFLLLPPSPHFDTRGDNLSGFNFPSHSYETSRESVARLASNQNKSSRSFVFFDGYEGRYAERACQCSTGYFKVNDNCRLCCCPLKIKYREFKKNSYISAQNLFKVSKHKGCIQGLTLAELCLHIGLETERSDTFSDRECHACGRNIQNSFNFHTFIA